MTTGPQADAAISIITGVLHRIAPEIDLTTLDPDEDLAEACDLDSMAFLSLVEGVSAIVDREIPERDFPRITTLSTFASHLRAGPPAGSGR